MKSFKPASSVILFCFFVQLVNAWQNVGIGTNSPHPGALPDVNSTTEGVLIRRMTNVQVMAISSPATGLLLYQLI